MSQALCWSVVILAGLLVIMTICSWVVILRKLLALSNGALLLLVSNVVLAVLVWLAVRLSLSLG